MRSLCIPAAVAWCWLMFCASASAENPQYRIIRRIPVGGDGGCESAVTDPKGRILYLARDTHLMAVDVKKDRITGDIPGLKGARGVALAPDLKRGFVTNSGADTVTVFHIKTLKTLGEVRTGQGPDSIVYEPVSKRVFAFNVKSRTATVFDAATGKVVKTIPMVGKPDNAVADGKGRVFVNIVDTSEVVELDGAKPGVVMRYVLNPGEEPEGIAVDRKSRRVFSGCANKLMTVLDTATIKVIAAVPIGEGVSDCAFDERSGLIFNANSEGTLTIIREVSPDRFEAVQSVGTQPGARTMALDARSGNVYLPAGDPLTVIVVGK